ncbi:MAG: dephospho-CoA kinase [Cyanobacteria bacterium J06626_18]
MGQRIIGITGGIATGKTTVSHYLETQHGLPVLDADVFARQAVEPGSAILRAIVQRYGAAILNADSTLHRQQLGHIVFNDPQEKKWIEQQIHPFVRQRFAQEMAKLTEAPTVVQAIPLLFEANLADQVTEIWVVTCSEATQLTRLMVRNALSQEAAQARIRNQWSLAEKAKRADKVLDNNSSVESLYQQVNQMLGNRRE